MWRHEWPEDNCAEVFRWRMSGKGSSSDKCADVPEEGTEARVARATVIHGECDLSEVRSWDVGSWPEHLEDCRS